MAAGFSLLIKPVGGACNLACRYCFYRGHPEGAIARATLERALEQYCALPFPGKQIILQGGEPLLAPPYVFDALENLPAEIAVQTNGTLIDDAVAARFAENGWLAGVSLDGPPALHERSRGAPWADAVRGIRALERAGAQYNILCVVTRETAPHAVEIERHFRDSFATRFHQYIECTGPGEEYAVGEREWGDFLVALFDDWLAEGMDLGISIRQFESLASQLVRGTAAQCSYARDCRHHLVLEHDGSVYPCDFFVDAAHRLGSVDETPLAALASSQAFADFAARKSALPARCMDCEFLAFCNGDCPRHQQRLCGATRRFFAHAIPLLAERLFGAGQDGAAR